MFRPLASVLHRSGIVSYLRRAWRTDDTELRDELKAEFARQLDTATKGLNDTVTDLRKRQADLRKDLRLLTAVVSANSGRLFARHPRALDFEAVVSHTSAAVAEAPLIAEPTAHLIVENVLPAATYAALLDATPPDECFPDRDLVKQNFRPSQGKLVPDFTEAMWSFFEKDIVASVLAPALVARFKPAIELVYRQRYGGLAETAAALPHGPTAGRLMLRRPGYHLEPHLDPRRVIVTCLIYFARPDDDASFGTQFFAVDGLGEVDQSKTYYPRESGYTCTLAKTVPFTPNTAVAFLNAGSAAHGATIPETAPPDTKRYAYQFYVSPDPARLAVVTGETADESQD